jgi:hypothetical protein
MGGSGYGSGPIADLKSRIRIWTKIVWIHNTHCMVKTCVYFCSIPVSLKQIPSVGTKMCDVTIEIKE